MNYRVTRGGGRVMTCLLAALIVVSTAGPVPAQEAASNLDVMEGLTREVAGDIVTAFDAARRGRPVRLSPAQTTEEYRFVESMFTSVLDERDVPVYTGAAKEETPADVLELRFETLEFGVEYPDVFRSYLIGGKNVRREAVVTIRGTLVDPASGAVLEVTESSRGESDEFSYGDLGTMERGTFEFLRPPMPSSGWTRVVEPVFVSGIIVGLIYLFFSNQSDE